MNKQRGLGLLVMILLLIGMVSSEDDEECIKCVDAAYLDNGTCSCN